MADLTSRTVIVAKGALFLGLVALSGTIAFLEAPGVKMLLLLVALSWASARFYYFLFYVLENYVDRSLRYSGILDLVRAVISRRRTGGGDGAKD